MKSKYSPKKTIYKKKYAKKYTKKIKIPKPLPLGEIEVSRIFQANDYNVPYSGFNAFLYFQPNVMPDYGTYAALYSEYKLKKVEIRIEPTFSEATLYSSITSSSSTTSYKLLLARVHSCLSYYENAAPTTSNAMMNKYGYKRTLMNRIHKRYIYPRYVSDINDSLVNTDSTLTNTWMSTANAGDAQFNGLQISFDEWAEATASATPTDLIFKVFVKYTMLFRKPLN